MSDIIRNMSDIVFLCPGERVKSAHRFLTLPAITDTHAYLLHKCDVFLELHYRHWAA